MKSDRSGKAKGETQVVIIMVKMKTNVRTFAQSHAVTYQFINVHCNDIHAFACMSRHIFLCK